MMGIANKSVLIIINWFLLHRDYKKGDNVDVDADADLIILGDPG